MFKIQKNLDDWDFAMEAAGGSFDAPLGSLIGLSPSTVTATSHRSLFAFLCTKAKTAIAHLRPRNSVCLSVRLSVHHTGGSAKNGAS